MKIIQTFFIFNIFLLLKISAHNCIHDTLNPPIKQIASPSLKTLPLGDRKINYNTYESIRIHADFSCNNR